MRGDLALVQTVDFFTPVVDDPFLFGQIAAANALSDIYTMGATPLTAMNLVAFPCRLGMERLASILKGGKSKIEEAGAVMVGGHSVDDREPKYGLAVTGVVHPDKMITNRGARPGQRLILTKPIGSGIISNLRKMARGRWHRLKGGYPITADVERACVQSMTTLNRRASEIMVAHGCTACTDVTGFGLLGHAHNVAAASGVSFELWVDQVPRFEGVLEAAIKGTAGGGHRNAEFVRRVVERDAEVSEFYFYLLCDAQTSGGLLMSIDVERTEACILALRQAGINQAAVVGRVLEGPAGRIVLKYLES